ncbi:MAG: cytosol aminopeptidase [[Candidatus Thermochlorobacteriaceae] bacterium GBChlB]|nr:MAG: cytosol aminopeptidase [[Candidatus Thermochlorobacteriaceae] bacterium GBChlB]
MKISISKAATETLSLDAAAFFVVGTDREKAVSNIASLIGVTATSIGSDFKAKEADLHLLYPQNGKFEPKRAVLLGLGEKPTLDSVRKAASAFAAKAREMKFGKIGVDLTAVETLAKHISESVDYVAQAVVEGVWYGAYDYDQLKTNRIEALKNSNGKKADEKKVELKELVLTTDADAASDVAEGAKVGDIIGSAQSMTRDLINSPSNYMTATDLANAAKASGKKYGYKVTVFGKKQLEELGMGGLLGVNAGSANPPTFSILEYKPTGKVKAKIAIVGKGVTFDTGGISLKPSENMGDMKADMSGAADVIGAVEAAARLKLPMHVIGIMPATDNKPSGTAQNPGDVLTTYSGITIEVDNTDAEGRLILADALTYAKEKFEPDAIIDLATLTGACVIALGNPTAGLFSNDDKLAELLFAAGLRSGEKVWRMPLWDDYDKQIKSDVADVKNTGGRGAGAITAAKFLEKFIGDHKSWAHLDIAGPAFPSMGGAQGKGSSGFGVRLLVEAMRRWN